MIKRETEEKDWIEYYNDRDILDEITDEEFEFSMDEHLRQDIFSGKRKRKLKNVTIKMDPLQIIAIKKVAAIKAMPYQTLIRHWLAEQIGKELDLVRR